MPPVKLCQKCKKNARRGGSGSYCVKCATEMMERKVKESDKILKDMKKPYEDLGLTIEFDGEEEIRKIDEEIKKLPPKEKQTKLVSQSKGGIK